MTQTRSAIEISKLYSIHPNYPEQFRAVIDDANWIYHPLVIEYEHIYDISYNNLHARVGGQLEILSSRVIKDTLFHNGGIKVLFPIFCLLDYMKSEKENLDVLSLIINTIAFVLDKSSANQVECLYTFINM